MVNVVSNEGIAKRIWHAYIRVVGRSRPTIVTYLEFYRWTRAARWLFARRVLGLSSLAVLFIGKWQIGSWSDSDFVFLRMASSVAALALALGVIPGDRFIRGLRGDLDAVSMPCGPVNVLHSAKGRGARSESTAPGRILAYSALLGVVAFGTLWAPVAWSDHVSYGSIQVSMYLDAKGNSTGAVDLRENQDYVRLESLKIKSNDQISWVLMTVPVLATTALIARLSNREFEFRAKTRYRVKYLP